MYSVLGVFLMDEFDKNKKKATIYDIAEALGISVGTVNRALHDKPRIAPDTKRKVLEMAKKMDFKVNQAAQSLRSKPIRIGVILNSPVIQHGEEMKRGIESVFAELENFNVGAYFPKRDFSKDCDTATYHQIEECIAKSVDGLIMHTPGDNKNINLSGIIQEAQNKGICVASVANEIKNVENVISVYADGESAGGLAAELLYLCCAKKNIGVLTGSIETNIHRENVQGFNKYAGSHPFKNIRIYEHHDDPELVVEATRRMFEEIPEIDGIYMTTSMAPIACAEIERKYKNRHVHIITTDLTDDIKPLLTEGKIIATVFQNPYYQGKKVATEVYRTIYEHKKAERYLTCPHLIFKSNMDICSKESSGI